MKDEFIIHFVQMGMDVINKALKTLAFYNATNKNIIV